ncbi:hypothetical protein [Streptomyces sp. NPDC059894]|uniref:hypothetical protein n=1 Tax=unclassified Streptomyces TaxID=2593676 RepID=UPI0036642D94
MAAAQVAWTPLEQAYGWVVDWGRSRGTAHPLAFRTWYVSRLSTTCPWHTSPGEGADGGDLTGRLTTRPS